MYKCSVADLLCSAALQISSAQQHPRVAPRRRAPICCTSPPADLPFIAVLIFGKRPAQMCGREHKRGKETLKIPFLAGLPPQIYHL